MNIYLISDGDEHKCWQAESMAQATAASELAYLEQTFEDRSDPVPESEIDAEREYYRESLLEQCTLIGPLANLFCGHNVEKVDD